MSEWGFIESEKPESNWGFIPEKLPWHKKVAEAISPILKPMDIAGELQTKDKTVPWMPQPQVPLSVPVLESIGIQEGEQLVSEALPSSAKVLAPEVTVPEWYAQLHQASPLWQKAQKKRELEKVKQKEREIIAKGGAILRAPRPEEERPPDIIPGVKPIIEAMEGTKEPLDAIMEAGYEVTSSVLLGKLIGLGLSKVANSLWFRKLTIPERDLVVQSLDDMISKGYKEGEVLRRWNNPTWRDQFFQRRPPEHPLTEEAPKTVKQTNKVVADLVKKNILVPERDGFVSDPALTLPKPRPTMPVEPTPPVQPIMPPAPPAIPPVESVIPAVAPVPTPKIEVVAPKEEIPPTEPFAEGKVPEKAMPIEKEVPKRGEWGFVEGEKPIIPEKPQGLEEIKKERQKAILQEIVKKDVEEAGKLPPEEFPIMKKKVGKEENIPNTEDFNISQWFNEHGKILTTRDKKTGKIESPGIDIQALTKREGAKISNLKSPFAAAGSGKGHTFDVLFQELQAEGYTGTIDDAIEDLGGSLTGLKKKVPVGEIKEYEPTEASIGTYSTGGGGAAPRPKEPPDRMVNIVEMPEMVELFNELSKGKYPTIKQRLRAFHGLAQGLYRTGKGKIELRGDIFQDPDQAKAVLAHEIFHFIDDLPDYMLKQRGNIFGRIASLNKYLKKYLEAYEGAPGLLTDADRSRLMREAREAVKLEKAVAEEQAAAFKDIKLLPEDIKSIWNDVEARSKNKPLYDFIVSLSEVEKNQIVREAMRGIVSEANQRRFRISVPIGGRPFKDWDQRLRDIFNKLVQEELEKRQLFTYDEMMSELKNLSMVWKPFTPTPGSKFTEYRFSPAELYADAGSVLLNNPAMLADKAPHFYKAFFNYLHRKPEVRQVYDDIQARIGSGEEEVLKHREKRVEAMLEKGEKTLAELRKPEPYNIIENLRKAFISRREPLLKLKRQVDKRGVVLDPEKNPDYWTEELPYISAPIFGMIRSINNTILKPAKLKDITQRDIDKYLLYRREATERAKIANPEGYTETDALKQMDFLRRQLGDEKFNNIINLAKEYWKIRNDEVFPVLEKSKALSPETMDLIKNNEEYVTFQVRKHLERQHGAYITSKIYKQIGTFKEVISPLTATTMKDMSLIRMAERKMIAESVVGFLQENFPDLIKPAKRGLGGRIVDSHDPKEGTIVYLHEGKSTGYYVPKGIADIFDPDPYSFSVILKALNAVQRPIKDIFVSKNPGWWIWNIQRDIKAMAKQVPGMSIPKGLMYLVKSFPDAYKDVFKDISTDDVKTMYKIKALGVGRYWTSSEVSPESHLDKIAQSFGETPASYDEALNAFEKLWKFVKAGNDLLDKSGSLGERLPKIATFKFLKENTSLSDKEIAHLDRKRAGSPDFWEKGGLDFLYNNIFFFSNAGKEGIRSAWEAAHEDPVNYTWKTFKYDVLPKLIMFAGAVGLLGSTVKHLMDNIPERDKANYLTIPIGLTADDKTVYFVMPHDFQGQVIGGLIWKIMRFSKPEKITEIIDYTAGGLPYTGLNPLLGLSTDWKQYLTGKNPYDPFRGKYVIPETMFQAGGAEPLKEMVKHSSNQLGGGIAYRFKGKDIGEVRSELEKIMGYPIIGNVLSRLLRVSDVGRTDELREVSEEVRKERAKELVGMDKAIKKLFDTHPEHILAVEVRELYSKLVKDKTVQRHTFDQFLDRITNIYHYRIGTPESDAILSAKSKEEKLRLVLKIFEKRGLGNKQSSQQINKEE